MKKKVAFMAPESKWWPYYIYEDIVDWLKKEHWKEVNVEFFHTKKDRIKLHFSKYDVIFSVIPFLFKPIKTKQYFYNLHWNFEIEKKRKWIWNKLLYLSKWNLRFCNKIILTSYFLADKLNFRKKYENKIEIIPNFVEDVEYIRPQKNFKADDEIKILTVSSTSFLEKWMWIVDLWEEIKKIKNKNILWTIIAGWDKNNMQKIQKEFYKINFPKNIKTIRLDRVEKEELKKHYKNNDIFIYWTRLDTWWMTIFEAINYSMPVLLLDYEVFRYIFKENFFIKNIKKDISNTLINYSKIQLNQKEYSLKYNKRNILELIFNLIVL